MNKKDPYEIFDRHVRSLMWFFSGLSLGLSIVSIFYSSWLIACCSGLALYFAWELREYIKDVLES